MEKTYKTLNGNVYKIGELPEEQKELFSKLIEEYKKGTKWNDFGVFWLHEGKDIWDKHRTKDLETLPIYNIAKDLGSRRGIEDGYTRMPDYRDRLIEIITMNYSSRYDFCKKTGIDESFLSQVLNKKKHFSMEKLTTILDKIGYKLDFSRREVS